EFLENHVHGRFSRHDGNASTGHTACKQGILPNKRGPYQKSTRGYPDGSIRTKGPGAPGDGSLFRNGPEGRPFSPTNPTATCLDAASQGDDSGQRLRPQCCSCRPPRNEEDGRVQKVRGRGRVRQGKRPQARGA